MNSVAAQALGSGNLRCDDSFRVAGTAAVDACGVFGRWNEWRDRIHVRGKNYFRSWLFGQGCIDIETVAFPRHFHHAVTDAGEFSVEIVADGGLITGDGFDVDELAGKRDCVHTKKNKLQRLWLN